jgi:predicted transposase/invertase (TIGR01784 family)
MNLKAVYEKWEAETIAEGKKEKSLEIARRLLTKQMSLAEIAELTDLTIEQIQELHGPGAAVTHR